MVSYPGGLIAGETSVVPGTIPIMCRSWYVYCPVPMVWKGDDATGMGMGNTTTWLSVRGGGYTRGAAETASS